MEGLGDRRADGSPELQHQAEADMLGGLTSTVGERVGKV